MYMYSDVFKFSEFYFGESLQIAKISHNYLPAKSKLYGIRNARLKI